MLATVLFALGGGSRARPWRCLPPQLSFLLLYHCGERLPNVNRGGGVFIGGQL